MVKLEVRKNTYYDSVTLMIISKDVKNLPGITEISRNNHLKLHGSAQTV